MNQETMMPFRAYWGVLRPHGQGRHEAMQSYGLELPSLEVTKRDIKIIDESYYSVSRLFISRYKKDRDRK